MGANNIKCCTDPNFAQGLDRDHYTSPIGYADQSSSPALVINEFQLCKKGEIHQEKIEIQM